MKKINKKTVLKDYDRLKKIAFTAYKFKLYSLCMDAITIAANLMYNFNIFYSDDDFEQLIKNISFKLFKNKCPITDGNSKRIVFYDYFSLDNRGLTEQYLQGLMDLNFEILYVTLHNDSNRMQNILHKLSNYSHAKICKVESLNNVQTCKQIVQEVTFYNPSKILFHSAPWDVTGFISLSYFEGKCERYLINLTDHAYWLGKCCSDYFLEFRSYGINISTKYRNINKSKLLNLPYYPITNSNISFQGFPFKHEGKKIILSGGSLYKIYGSSFFFEVIKFILNSFKDTVFFYLGNGDDRPIKKFISENNFEDRFCFSKERKDINEIFKRCYFYLGTYPISGALMSQFAAFNNKIPVAYTDPNLPINNIDEFFINCDEKKFTYTNKEEYFSEIKKLLTDEDYYIQRSIETKNLIISKEDFAVRLKDCLENKRSTTLKREYDIDINNLIQIYIDQENKFIHSYSNYFMVRKNIIIILIFIRYAVHYYSGKFRGQLNRLFKLTKNS